MSLDLSTSDLTSVTPFQETSLSGALEFLPISSMSSDFTSETQYKESSIIGTSEIFSRSSTMSSDLSTITPF